MALSGRVVSGDGYTAHWLHTGERIWVESNCYVDLWIELLHGRGLDPLAMLGFCLAGGDDADQWTFVKPPLAELWKLYGADVNELNVYRTLVEHTVTQTARGHAMLIEVDSWVLPDTRGTTYRNEHGKTAIAIDEIDPDKERIWYFHNAGRYSLDGEDYRIAMRVGAPPEILPPYVELAKFRGAALRGDALKEAARELTRAHFARRPAENPLRAWGKVVAADVAQLQTKPLAEFHYYAFAWVRQCGAAAELAGLHLRWLGEEGAAAGLIELAQLAKAAQFKLARAVNGKRAVDANALVEPLAEAWARAMERAGEVLR